MRELLFEKYCLGTLEADEIRELKEGLSGNRETRQAMARYLEERSILVQLTGRKTAELPARQCFPVSARPKSRIWIGGAACLLIGLLLVVLLPTSERAALRYERPVLVATEPVREPVMVEAPRPAVEPKREIPPAPLVIPRRESPVPVAEPRPAKEAPRPATVTTVKAVAVIERSTEAKIKAGQELFPGNSLATGPKGTILLRCPDGTRLELSASTSILGFDDSRGLRVILGEGTIHAQVAKRPEGQPLVVSTRLGDATVLGTSFQVIAAATTRLEVTEGKVRLTRSRDAKSVDVAAGQYAVISGDADLVARSLPRTLVTEEFDRMPSWSSTYDAKWGGAASWSLGGSALQAGRPGKGSSVMAIVYTIPSAETLDLSLAMKCPKLAGRQWVEFGYRLGEHKASDFDISPDKWTVVKKFDGDDGPNGNGNSWTRYAAKVETGAFTKITVGFKLGSFQTSMPAVGWDALKISIP